MRLRLRDQAWEFDGPVIMGIVNASPDSVSDRVPLRTVEEQVEHALQLAEDGARIIDVGGESGRTDVAPVTDREEAARVLPLVERLVEHGLTVSIDTWKPEVARLAVDAGAAMINDVSGLRDPEIADVAAESGAALVVMHTRADPKVEHFPGYDDLVADVSAFLRERAWVATERGVHPEQIVLDPGPDFAKRPPETIELLRRLPELAALGRPLLLAVSRKYFLGAITGRPPDERLGSTLAAVAHAVDGGAAILRLHDVREAADFLAVREALRANGAPRLAPNAGDEDIKWLPPSASRAHK